MIETISRLQGNAVGVILDASPSSIPLVHSLDDAAEVLKCCEDWSLYEVYILPVLLITPAAHH